MVKKILSIYIVALCALIYSCSGIYGMDDAVQEYQPRASRSSLFKTSLIGLGLMLSPQQVDAMTFPTRYSDGCYLVKGIYQPILIASEPIRLIISEIRTIGFDNKPIPNQPVKCNKTSPFSEHGVPKNISMVISLSNSEGYVNDYDYGMHGYTYSIDLCDNHFRLAYETCIKGAYDMKGNKVLLHSYEPQYFMLSISDMASMFDDLGDEFGYSVNQHKRNFIRRFLIVTEYGSC